MTSWSEIIKKRGPDLVDCTQVSPELVNHLWANDVITRNQRDTLTNRFTENTYKAGVLYNEIAEGLTEAKIVHFKAALKTALCDRALQILNEKKAPTFDVVDQSADEESYPSGKNFALIINVHTDRPGAEKDDPALRDTLEGCGFEISMCGNWTKKGIEKAIEDFKTKLAAEKTKIGSVLIVVASHGTNYDYFQSSLKEELSLDGNVIDQFNGANCGVLRGIPKVFLVNICRGKKFDAPAAVSHEAVPNTTRLPSELSVDEWWKLKTSQQFQSVHSESGGAKPTWWDLLVAYASYDGHEAYRDPLKGSWFLQVFCEVVRAEAKGKPVCIKRLLEKVSDEIKNKTKETLIKQSPTIKHTGFTKRLPFQYC